MSIPIVGSCRGCNRALVSLRDWCALTKRQRKAARAEFALNAGASLCSACPAKLAAFDRKVRAL